MWSSVDGCVWVGRFAVTFACLQLRLAVLTGGSQGVVVCAPLLLRFLRQVICWCLSICVPTTEVF